MAPRVLHVAGTNHEVGFQIGKALKKEIQDVLSSSEDCKKLLYFLGTSDGRRIYDGYLTTAKAAYPNYVEELVGMSKGADVPFKHLFLLNYTEEILLLMDKNEKEGEFKGCTTVFLNYRDGPRLLAHNEDGPTFEEGCLLVAHVEPYELPGGKVLPEENFVSFCYSGLLAGVAYSYNCHGLCLTYNTLTMTEAEENKLGIVLSCRALLSATSPEEAMAMMKADGVGMAIGDSLNLTSTRDRTERMYSVETAPAVGQATTLMSVHTVEPADGGTDGHFYHYNLYEHHRMSEVPLSPSSVHRKARASEMKAPRVKEDVLAFLGDTDDPEYPIYRYVTEKDKAKTLSTAVFDLQEGVLEIYIGNPTVSKEQALQFYLPC